MEFSNEFLTKLLERGCHDVPTLKLMTAEDNDALGMTQQQKAEFI